MRLFVFFFTIFLASCTSSEVSNDEIRRALDFDGFKPLARFVGVSLGDVTIFREDEYTLSAEVEMVIVDKTGLGKDFKLDQQEIAAFKSELREAGYSETQILQVGLQLGLIPLIFMPCTLASPSVPNPSVAILTKRIIFKNSNKGWIASNVTNGDHYECQ